MKVIHHDIGRDPMYKIWHCIDGNMIIYMHSEGGSIVFQDKIYPIKKGSLCFIGADKQHHTLPDNPATYDRSKIIVPDSCVKGYLNLLPEKDELYSLFANNSVVYAEIPPDVQKSVEFIYKEAEDALSESTKDFRTVMCCFFRLMSLIKKYTIEHIGLSDDFLTRAIDIINRRSSAQISLDDICREMHMSKYHFCRKFKSAMGITVMDYILKTRLVAAKNALATDNLTVNEISEQCGFSSISYFCQAFKKHVGMSALEYRRKIKAETD